MKSSSLSNAPVSPGVQISLKSFAQSGLVGSSFQLESFSDFGHTFGAVRLFGGSAGAWGSSLPSSARQKGV